MAHLQIKYCGSQSRRDLQCTINSRADYIGLIFAKESKRRVTVDQAAAWLNQHPVKDGQNLVGLFVNARPQDIQFAAEQLPLHVIQCHGSESAERVREIGRRTGLPVWKAIHHHDDAIARMRHYAGAASGFVIDCKVQGAWGGTGQSFDWSCVPAYMKEAERQGVRCLIAGGIHAGNIGELLRYEPDGIDVSSGIEVNGRKDPEAIRTLEERMCRYEANEPR